MYVTSSATHVSCEFCSSDILCVVQLLNCHFISQQACTFYAESQYTTI